MANLEKIKLRALNFFKPNKLRTKQIAKPMFDISHKKYESYYNLNEFDLFFLRPNIINNKIKEIKINDTYFRILYITGFPSEVVHGFIDELIKSDVNFDIVENIKPIKKADKVAQLEKSLTNTKLALAEVHKKGQYSARLDRKESNTISAMKLLSMGKEKAFEVGIGIAVKSTTKELLELETNKVKDVLDGISIDTKIFEYQQEDGIRSFLPNNGFHIQTKDMLTSSLSAFFPFTENFLETDKEGVILGVNQNTQIPIILDIFKLPNSNGVIVGTSGSGKSFTVKSIAIRYALKDYSLYVIDPNSEYIKLFQVLGGQVVNLNPKSQTMINPLDLMGHSRDNKIENLKVCMNILVPALTEQQWGVFRDVCEKVYEEFGITRDLSSKEAEGIKMPLLKDIYDWIKKDIDTRLNSGKTVSVEWHKLLNHLKPFAYGAYDYLSKDSNIEWNNNKICFAIEGMPDSVSGALMFLVMDLIKNKVKSFKNERQNQTYDRNDLESMKKAKEDLENDDVQRGFIIVDEAWMVLVQSGGAYIKNFAKTIRKDGMSLLVITQEVGDLETTDGGRAMLSNSSFNLILKQKPNQIPAVVHAFNLSSNEISTVQSATHGEGVLIADREHYLFKSILSPDEIEISETDFKKMIEIDIRNLTKYHYFYDLIIDKGLEELGKSERDNFFKFRAKRNKSKEEKEKFKELQDKILGVGKDKVSGPIVLEFEKLDFLYSSKGDTKKALEEVKKINEKPLEMIRTDILKKKYSNYVLSELNESETQELKDQGFTYVSFDLGGRKKRHVEFMSKFFEKKSKKPIKAGIIEIFQNARRMGDFLKDNPQEINHVYTFHHQSLINLTEFLLQEQEIDKIEKENENIEDRPDVWWLNPNGLACVIEVESGSREYDVTGLLRKKEIYTRDYQNRWFILVPNSKLKLHYEKELDLKGRVIIKTELDKTLKYLNSLDLEIK